MVTPIGEPHCIDMRPITRRVRMEIFMDVNDRITRLEDALIDLAVVVSEGHLDHLAAANMSPVVVEAGRQLQAFHREVIDEREL